MMEVPPQFNYDNFVARNMYYINSDVQSSIKNCRILIAGCGIGSSFAILAARMGFTKFILVDGDTVSPTNLNRQFYYQHDINTLKVNALKNHILEINPDAEVEAIDSFLTIENISKYVEKADFIFDTIDFLDLVAIVELHDQCSIQKKPRITALSIGFDGGLLYFPADAKVSFRELFNLPLTGSVEDISYMVAFGKIMQKLGGILRPEVIYAVSQALKIMEDGTPCPASQVSPGSFTVAALAGTVLYKIFSGEKVQEAPYFIISNHHKDIETSTINFLEI